MSVNPSKGEGLKNIYINIIRNICSPDNNLLLDDNNLLITNICSPAIDVLLLNPSKGERLKKYIHIYVYKKKSAKTAPHFAGAPNSALVMSTGVSLSDGYTTDFVAFPSDYRYHALLNHL